MAGQQVLAEMGEQPSVLEAIAAQRSALQERIRAAVPHQPHGICLVARGSSDNVAVHARYLLELATGLPVSMAAPSLVTRYGASLKTAGYLVIALSQSGRTPEIVSVAASMRAQGAAIVAVTNEVDSPLAESAAVTLSVGTSKELAVPATKTVTGQLALVTLLAEAIGEGLGVDMAAYTGGDSAWGRLADVVRDVLVETESIDAAVDILRPRRSAIHLARGLTYAAALEGALKSKETSRRVHDGYSSADFLHGPLTVAGPEVPVVGYGSAGPVLDDVVETVRRAAALGAPVVGVGDRAIAAGIGDAAAVGVPGGLGEALDVIPLVVRGQQLAIATTIALGMDPDSPEGLNKVTATH